MAKKLPPERGGGNRQRAIEARGAEFDMRSNMKAAPNSQGTLFQGGNKTDAHRWPRGYSPTRMQAVKDTVPVTMTHGPDALDMERHSGLHGHHELGHPYLNPESPEHTKRLAREPLARSTHPIEDLKGLSMHLDFGARGANSQVNQNKQAYYDSSTRGMTVNPMTHYPQSGRYGLGAYAHPGFKGPSTGNDIALGDHRQALASADTTVLHEAGHHVDMTKNMAEYHERIQKMGKITPTLRGHLESQADASMIEHHRNDPRNQRVTGHDVHRETYGQRGAPLPAGYRDPSKFARFTDHSGGNDHLLQGALFNRNMERSDG